MEILLLLVALLLHAVRPGSLPGISWRSDPGTAVAPADRAS
jgi:hypothetical protein